MCYKQLIAGQPVFSTKKKIKPYFTFFHPLDPQTRRTVPLQRYLMAQYRAIFYVMITEIGGLNFSTHMNRWDEFINL